jgi:hypothetical protein
MLEERPDPPQRAVRDCFADLMSKKLHLQLDLYTGDLTITVRAVTVSKLVTN